jgi:catechol 2,3-dioxygenase-like lactoylglutathione lyase family enzyme
MHLLDHVSISVTDLAQARPFYDAVMSELGCEKVYDRADALGFGVRCRAPNPDETYLAVYQSPAAVSTADPRRHWCFKAATRTAVDAFYAAALANGGSCDGPPGLRPDYHPHYYAAFVLDPSRNRLEAVCHAAQQTGAAGTDGN